jgi:hypothetical protein
MRWTIYDFFQVRCNIWLQMPEQTLVTPPQHTKILRPLSRFDSIKLCFQVSKWGHKEVNFLVLTDKRGASLILGGCWKRRCVPVLGVSLLLWTTSNSGSINKLEWFQFRFQFHLNGVRIQFWVQFFTKNCHFNIYKFDITF